MDERDGLPSEAVERISHVRLILAEHEMGVLDDAEAGEALGAHFFLKFKGPGGNPPEPIVRTKKDA